MKANYPNFFIVGAAKCGTSSLAYYLSQHPFIFISAIKEPDFFSHQELEKQQLYYQSPSIKSKKLYLDLFKGVKNETVIGEASVSYLFYPKTAQNIYEFNPKSKIIILLKDPIKRAISHYLMDYRLGLVSTSLDEIIADKGNKMKYHYQQYISLGKYSSQVKQYYNVFGKDQVKVYFSDNDIINFLPNIYRFLGVDTTFELIDKEQQNQNRAFKNPILKKVYQNHKLRNMLKNVIPNIITNRIKTEKVELNLNSSSLDYMRTIYKEENAKLEGVLGEKCWDYNL